MPVFAYKARDIKGRLSTDTIDAASGSEAADSLRQKGLFVVDIKQKNNWRVNLAKSFTEIQFNALFTRRRVKLKELAVFCRQFATVIDAGIPLISALSIVSQQTENKALQQALQDVLKNVEGGDTLAESFGRHRTVFPEIFVYMVEAGEIGGVLDEVLERMARHFEREYEMNEKIKTALTYPKIVVIFSVVAVMFLLSFVLPNIISVVESMGVPLPLPTRMLMALSGGIVSYWYLVLLALPVVWLVGYLFKNSPQGRQIIDTAALRLPIFGPLTQKVIIVRFAHTLGMLIKGGVPIVAALEVVKKSTGNTVVTSAISEAQQVVQEGGVLSMPLAACNVFPPMVIKMISVGEETGNLDELLERTAAFYDQEVNLLVGRLSAMLEPVVIVLLGGIVGFVILAILLPMMQSMTEGLV